MLGCGLCVGQKVDIRAARSGLHRPAVFFVKLERISCYPPLVARSTLCLVCALGAMALANVARAAEAERSAAEERDPILVRPFLQIQSAEAALQADDDSEIELVPNPTQNVGVKVGAWGLSAALSVGVGHVESVAEYGKSDNFNFEISYPFPIGEDHELFVTAFLHYHQTLSTISAGERQIIEGARLMTLGFDAAFMLEPKFSLDRVLGDFAPRPSSAGSWFLRASAGLWLIGFANEPDRLLIPVERRFELGDFGDLNHLNMAFLTFGGGYVYDWNIFHHFFLTALGNLGLDVSAVDLYFVARERDIAPAIGPAVALQLGLSYVGSHFHTGLTANATADFANARGVDIIGQRINALLFLGVRF